MQTPTKDMGQTLQSLLSGKRLTAEDLKAPVRSTGTSDSIPAVITDKKGKAVAPARLSEGEFVINAEVVSKAGGGATDPGMAFFDTLQAMFSKMDRFQASEFADMVIILGEEVLSQSTVEEEVVPNGSQET